MCLDCGSIRLRAQDVADRVTLKSPAHTPGKPMDVLQAAVTIVGRNDADVTIHCGTPGARQISGPESSLQHAQFQFEAEHDVEIVSDLVGFGPDQRALHFVDSAVERLEGHSVKLPGKGCLQHRVEKLPKSTAAADHVFP